LSTPNQGRYYSDILQDILCLNFRTGGNWFQCCLKFVKAHLELQIVYPPLEKKLLLLLLESEFNKRKSFVNFQGENVIKRVVSFKDDVGQLLDIKPTSKVKKPFMSLTSANSWRLLMNKAGSMMAMSAAAISNGPESTL